MNHKLQEAITAIKADDKKTGYRLLIEVIKAKPSSKDVELAWLWMSVVVKDLKKKRQCLETVLAMNPNNELAQKRIVQLDSLSQKSQTSPSVESVHVSRNSPEAATKTCPYCAETIKIKAKVCRFCGRQLVDLPKSTPTQHEPATHPAYKQQQISDAGIMQDIKDVGKSTASVAFGILSAPLIAVALSLLLLMACCGGCYFLGEIGSLTDSSGSESPSNNRSLPATFTPVSIATRQPHSQTYSGIGRQAHLVRVPSGYNTIEIVMVGSGFSYFEVWTTDEELLMDGSCEEEDCIISNEARLRSNDSQVEIVFNAVRRFGSVEGEAWAAEVFFLRRDN